MLKTTTGKEKVDLLGNWMTAIIGSIKKDLKNDHLKTDVHFFKKYFPGKNINKLSLEELAVGYGQAFKESENVEELTEFFFNRWLLKHGDVYRYFEEKLTQINPNFSELVEIERELAFKIMEEAVDQFGALQTYLFSVINSVVFPKEVFVHLNERALTEKENETAEAESVEEQASKEAMVQFYEQQIARLMDKYEKKLDGLQRKYVQDTEMLKKQVANLQRKK